MMPDTLSKLRTIGNGGAGSHSLSELLGEFSEPYLADVASGLPRKPSFGDSIRAGLRNEHFSLVFQPIFKASTRDIVGFEGLLRWHDPELGSVDPEIFIAFAEENGLIVDIGRLVLKTAVRQLSEWRRFPQTSHLFLSVNVSALELETPSYAADLGSLMNQYGVDPSLLVLEVTERVGLDETFEKLTELDDLGVRLCIDDFGTGYSSLSYLDHSPFGSLKVDKSFLSGFLSASSGNLIRTMLMMAGSLGMRSVVEGVETEEQLLALIELDADLVQGFYLGRPMAADRVQQFCLQQSAEDDPMSLASRAIPLAMELQHEYIPGGVLCCNEAQSIIWCSTEVEEIFGYGQGQLRGLDLEVLIPASVRDLHKREFDQFTVGANSELPMSGRSVLRGVRKDGGVVFLDISLSRQTIEGSVITVAFIYEVPERERAVRRLLEEQIEEKNVLIATVAHELRTPLSTVLGFARILGERCTQLPPADEDEIFELLISEGESLSYIVDDLLTAAQWEAGTLNVVLEPIDLGRITKQVSLSSDGLTEYASSVIEPLVEGIGDERRVVQILRNLITNARRYGGPRISLEVGSGDGTVSVFVIDDGEEIPMADRETIFEPYQRARQDIYKTVSLGLGLTVSRKLARRMGGDLTYGYVDGHSRFELTLVEA